MCAQQLLHDLGLPGTAGDAPALLAHASRLIADFAAARPAYDGLDPRERGPADELVALAATALMAMPAGALCCERGHLNS